MYAGLTRIYCPTAALRRGCPGIERALVSLDELAALGRLDEDDLVEAVLLACGGCADPHQCEVGADGVVCLLPLDCDSRAIERDLAELGGHHG